MEIKQTDMPPAEAARRTKEFRCPPKEQMFRLLKCKVNDERSTMILDDEEATYDACPMSDSLQEQLRDFCAMVVAKIGNNGVEDEKGDTIDIEEESSWVDSLAQLVISVPPAPEKEDLRNGRNGTQNFK